jgi:hypothetical protein
MVEAVRKWRRPVSWLLLGLLGWQVVVLGLAATARDSSFHHVPNDRLQALAFLRREVPVGQIVIHPWIDDLIRSDASADKVDWVYKRHFTLGSNLAGQQMWYEGREDHLFIGGYIPADEVYRRSRLRRKFYQTPDRETVEAITGRDGAAWVVADAEHSAPAEIAHTWPVVFGNSTVRIYQAKR